MTFKTWDFRGVFKEDFEGDFEGDLEGDLEGDSKGQVWSRSGSVYSPNLILLSLTLK